MYFSRYHTVLTVNGKNFLFNTFNSSLIELNDVGWKEYLLLKKGQYKNISIDTLNLLKSQDFLLASKDEDEKRKKQIHDHYLTSKFENSKSVKIDIGITNRCNFHCPYCFENGNKNNKIYLNDSPSTYFMHLSAKILEYVSEQLTSGVKLITLTWYGGEPSLEWDFILNTNEKLAKICNLYQCSYSNIVVTNGYYLPDSVLSAAPNQHFQYIQITLDGPENHHNSRRNINSTTNSYSKIISNIMKLLSAKIEVVIRINIDKTNADKAKVLLNNLADTFPKNEIGKRLFVSFGRVFGSEESYSLDEYEDVYREVFTQASMLNFVIPSINVSLLSAFCSAESINNNIVIDYMGSAYCCWNDIFDKNKSVGNIFNKNFEEERASLSSLYYDELSLEKVNNGKCLECELINFCQGMCPYNRLQIKNTTSKNIYLNDFCKQIIKKRLATQIAALLLQRKNR
ncbi:MAG: SPASM domain-containing protein [Finegoldia magna]|nr:SPASM domain-containing protein [Finegoldia magna]MDD7543904.1 SPASM domain-containing protein [Peptoniphilaceae bacterium]MDY5766726.1 SPASM domain-containing protein [Peptoniphilaceae bacterium]